MLNATGVFSVIVTLVLLFAISAAPALAEPIPGQAVVKLGLGVSPSQAFNGAGVTAIDSIPDMHLYLVEFPTEVSFESKKSELSGRRGITGVEANQPMSLLETHQMSISIPEEREPVFLTGEEPVAYYGQPAVYSIGLDSAHVISRGAGIRVAVIDNGVDTDHPLFLELPDSLGHDFVDRDSDPAELEGALYGHGTFVAGLVRLAVPEGELLVARAFDADGISTSFTVVQAINWAVTHQADVINMSFGTLSESPVLAQACEVAIDAGVVLVASVGNNNQFQEAVYPAAYPGVIAVSAIGPDDYMAPFSNSGNFVDVCAPGVNLYSALPYPSAWGTWSGTSFSTPLVAAVCGLVQAVESISPEAMELHIRATATRELAWGSVEAPDPMYGYGRVDAYTAVLNLSLGDMNLSGALDVDDLSVVSSLAASENVTPDVIRRQADMNGDAEVDQADVEILSGLLFGGNGSSGSGH